MLLSNVSVLNSSLIQSRANVVQLIDLKQNNRRVFVASGTCSPSRFLAMIGWKRGDTGSNVIS
jgi:hypothetical protein